MRFVLAMSFSFLFGCCFYAYSPAHIYDSKNLKKKCYMNVTLSLIFLNDIVPPQYNIATKFMWGHSPQKRRHKSLIYCHSYAHKQTKQSQNNKQSGKYCHISHPCAGSVPTQRGNGETKEDDGWGSEAGGFQRRIDYQRACASGVHTGFNHSQQTPRVWSRLRRSTQRTPRTVSSATCSPQNRPASRIRSSPRRIPPRAPDAQLI